MRTLFVKAEVVAAMQILRIDHVQLAMPAGLAQRGGAWFQEGLVKIHLRIAADFRPALKAHPALLVGDLASFVSRLGEAGIQVLKDDELPGYNRVYVSDPFGNRLELMEERT